MKKVGVALVAVWALVFLAGAAGEIFQIDALRRVTDLKSIFLR